MKYFLIFGALLGGGLVVYAVVKKNGSAGDKTGINPAAMGAVGTGTGGGQTQDDLIGTGGNMWQSLAGLFKDTPGNAAGNVNYDNEYWAAPTNENPSDDGWYDIH